MSKIYVNTVSPLSGNAVTASHGVMLSGVASGTLAGPSSYLGIDTEGLMVLSDADHPSSTPGGSDTEIQYNDGGAFGGVSSLTYADGTGHLIVADDKKIYFGGDEQTYIVCDTTGTKLEISGAAAGIALSGSLIDVYGEMRYRGGGLGGLFASTTDANLISLWGSLAAGGTVAWNSGIFNISADPVTDILIDSLNNLTLSGAVDTTLQAGTRVIIGAAAITMSSTPPESELSGAVGVLISGSSVAIQGGLAITGHYIPSSSIHGMNAQTASAGASLTVGYPNWTLIDGYQVGHNETRNISSSVIFYGVTGSGQAGNTQMKWYANGSYLEIRSRGDNNIDGNAAIFYTDTYPISGQESPATTLPLRGYNEVFETGSDAPESQWPLVFAAGFAYEGMGHETVYIGGPTAWNSGKAPYETEGRGTNFCIWGSTGSYNDNPKWELTPFLFMTASTAQTAYGGKNRLGIQLSGNYGPGVEPSDHILYGVHIGTWDNNSLGVDCNAYFNSGSFFDNPTSGTLAGAGSYLGLAADGQMILTASAGGGGGAVTALNNAVQSRLVTIGSTTTELDGEADITYDGTTFLVSGSQVIFTGSSKSRSPLQQPGPALRVATNADSHTLFVSGSLIQGTVGINISAPSPNTALDVVHNWSRGTSPATTAGHRGGGHRLKFGAQPQFLQEGELYHLSGAAGWTTSSAGAPDNGISSGSYQLLGLGMGGLSKDTNSTSNDGKGVLLEGYMQIPSIQFVHVPSNQQYGLAGLPLYAATASGKLDFESPSGSGEFVRVVGYALEQDFKFAEIFIRFNPDPTWVDVT